MAKKKTKRRTTKEKLSQNKKHKKSKDKKHKLLDTKVSLFDRTFSKSLSDIKLGPKNFIKKYPGFIIALIIAIIIIMSFIFLGNATDPNLEEKIYYAQQLHIENELMVEDSLASVEAELDGTYDDILEEYYLVSIKSDLEWLKKEENTLFLSKPTGDVFVKEVALLAFRNRMVEVNQSFIFDMMDSDMDYAIKTALEKEPLQNIVTEEEMSGLFEDERDKQVFLITLNQIIKSYYTEKKNIINDSSSQERRFVEAKKILLFSY